MQAGVYGLCRAIDDPPKIERHGWFGRGERFPQNKQADNGTVHTVAKAAKTTSETFEMIHAEPITIPCFVTALPGNYTSCIRGELQPLQSVSTISPFQSKSSVVVVIY